MTARAPPAVRASTHPRAMDGRCKTGGAVLLGPVAAGPCVPPARGAQICRLAKQGRDQSDRHTMAAPPRSWRNWGRPRGTCAARANEHTVRVVTSAGSSMGAGRGHCRCRTAFLRTGRGRTLLCDTPWWSIATTRPTGRSSLRRQHRRVSLLTQFNSRPRACVAVNLEGFIWFLANTWFCACLR